MSNKISTSVEFKPVVMLYNNQITNDFGFQFGFESVDEPGKLDILVLSDKGGIEMFESIELQKPDFENKIPPMPHWAWNVVPDYEEEVAFVTHVHYPDKHAEIIDPDVLKESPIFTSDKKVFFDVPCIYTPYGFNYMQERLKESESSTVLTPQVFDFKYDFSISDEVKNNFKFKLGGMLENVNEDNYPVGISPDLSHYVILVKFGEHTVALCFFHENQLVAAVPGTIVFNYELTNAHLYSWINILLNS